MHWDAWIPIIFQALIFIIGGATAWQKLVGKLNGFGDRLSTYERECTALGGRVSEISEQQMELRLEFGSKLHEQSNELNARDSEIRERLVRVEERNGIHPKD